MSHYRNFTPPFEIPDSWEWVRLDEIATSNIGLTYSPQDIVEDGVPVYRSNNIKDNKICLDEIVYVSCHILEKQYLHNGDLLICARNGSRRLVGKNIIIENLERPTSFGAFMAVCRSCYNPWIKLLLDSAYFNSYLDESNSTAINQITQKMLLDFVLPFPPQKEQSRINAAFQSIECIIDIIEQRESELKTGITNLKYRILDLAMQGKLVPQDPTDEPAADMLRRINPKAKIITDNPHSWNMPKGWVMTALKELIIKTSSKQYQILQSEIKPKGKIPVISQSSNFIEGYSDNYNTAFHPNNGIVIFGDHTKIVKFFSADFIIGADGVKLIDWGYNKRFLYYLIKNVSEKIPNKGYSRHSQYLFKYIVGLPPLREQMRIVAKIEELYSILDKIEASLQS